MHADQNEVVLEIEQLREILKDKWTLKFDVDARIISLDGYLKSILSVDQMDVLDEAFLKGVGQRL